MVTSKNKYNYTKLESGKTEMRINRLEKTVANLVRDMDELKQQTGDDCCSSDTISTGSGTTEKIVLEMRINRLEKTVANLVREVDKVKQQTADDCCSYGTNSSGFLLQLQ
jgi:uncharacterized protein YceH (UPF0502 family)